MSAPSRKQLVNFVAVTAFGPSAGVFERMTVEALLEMPSVREVWLKRHRELQAALSSEDATRPTPAPKVVGGTGIHSPSEVGVVLRRGATRPTGDKE